METLEDFDFSLQYHLGKANVVADALSRKSRSILSGLMALMSGRCMITSVSSTHALMGMSLKHVFLHW